MKTIIRYIVCVAALCMAASCTQNNGNIGDFFGAWVLRSMTIDGVEKTFADNEYTTLRFQSHIAMFNLFVDEQSQYVSLATWTDDDSSLLLNFDHSDDNNGTMQGPYAPPAWLEMPHDDFIRLTITRLDGKHLDLLLNTPESQTITYNFERTW
ncbi:MAG: lipocalin-like domain-containing protein [Muribaculaceae bacterium]|nr:lipocalin-like domain-containing protein [Muribaculaceae bacterium]